MLLNIKVLRLMSFSSTRFAAITLSFALGGACSAASGDRPLAMSFDGIFVGDVVQRELLLSNPSKTAALAIQEIGSSCTCLRVLSKDDQLPPGGTGKIVVEYRPTKTGQTSLELLIALAGGKDEMISYRWTGAVLPKLRGAGDAELSKRFITPENAQALLSNASVTVFDLRESARFAECHIKGALNVPFEFLRASSFAKEKNVVLTGSGVNDSELLMQAQALSAGSPSIKVLRGGVRRWQTLGYPVEGSASTRFSAAIVSPSEFALHARDGWVLFADQKESTTHTMFAKLNVPVVGLSSLSPDILVPALVEQSPSMPSQSKVLIATRSAVEYDAIERQLPHDVPVPVFYLAGSLDELQQTLQLRGQSGRVVSIHSTDTSPIGSGQGLSHSAEGCKTCPQSSNISRSTATVSTSQSQDAR